MKQVTKLACDCLSSLMASKTNAMTKFASSLVADAVAGIAELKKLNSNSINTDDEDLTCLQCRSLLFNPTTLEDGVTVCQACVRKYRDSLKSVKNSSCSRSLPSWVQTPDKIGFGQSVNLILSDLTESCCPKAHTAAQCRHRANGLFADQKFAEAIEAYSLAISSSPLADVVLLCNRSIARLKLKDVKGALEDSLEAVALCEARSAKYVPGSPAWAKAWFRVGHALLRLEGQELGCVFALAMFAAANPEEELPTHLLDAIDQMVATKAATSIGVDKYLDDSEDILNLKRWLRQGTCPTLKAQYPEVNTEESGSFQLSLGDLTCKEHCQWVQDRLECALCLCLLWKPSTLPCGHSLCHPCLARTLDHAFDTAPVCPMCRKDLSSYLSWLNAHAQIAGSTGGLNEGYGAAQIPVNRKLEHLLKHHFQTETTEREEQIKNAEAAAGEKDSADDGIVVSIFVCSIGVPGIMCPLHIFEPRYRLMMRRCIESGQRQFGMCLFPEAPYGTMLQILDFSQLPDGRSLVKTIGTRRFQVLKWGEKDGYSTGTIKWIQDADEPDCPEVVKQLSPDVLELQSHIDRLLNHLGSKVGKEEVMSKIEDQLGPRPIVDVKEGKFCPSFVFWSMGLAQLSSKRTYQLCFDDAYRCSPAKRLKAVLDHMKDLKT